LIKIPVQRTIRTMWGSQRYISNAPLISNFVYQPGSMHSCAAYMLLT